jgi:hypothetical protein
MIIPTKGSFKDFCDGNHQEKKIDSFYILGYLLGFIIKIKQFGNS